jgi:thioredoxin-related protein
MLLRHQLLGLLLGLSLIAPAVAGGRQWLRDVDHALAVARAEQRPLVLFITTDGCIHCERMIATTFLDPQVRQTLGTSFVAAAIKASERPDLLKRLSIRSFPTTLVVSADGRVMDQVVGYLDADKFTERMVAVLKANERPATVARGPARGMR